MDNGSDMARRMEVAAEGHMGKGGVRIDAGADAREGGSATNKRAIRASHYYNTRHALRLGSLGKGEKGHGR